MVNAMLLYCCALQLILCFGAIRAELDSNAVRDVTTNADFTSLSRGKTLFSAAGPLTKPTLEKEHQMSEKMMLNPELMFDAVEMDRSERSPRRCVRHLESCFGHALPCCDPCTICYCRFFKAICYCRKIGSDCDQGKN
ncbi:agouti-related protein-like [Mobula hypostoma]|uniref:agouti-related protein-like n=1 Tax=Mobula hypostoma TaxID=723540 RepID=UPI002FC29F2E